MHGLLAAVAERVPGAGWDVDRLTRPELVPGPAREELGAALEDLEALELRGMDVWGHAAARMFEGAPGEPELKADVREVNARGRAALVGILGADVGAANLAGAEGAVAFEMSVELIRAGLTGLAVWWRDHPEVPREHATATNVLRIGFERAAGGKRWNRHTH